MVTRGIASILHRDTIAVIVGARTFERGEQCFSGKRLLVEGLLGLARRDQDLADDFKRSCLDALSRGT